VSFEGPEGGGKSTQVQMLAIALRELGYDVCRTREPGGTPLGERLRETLKGLGTDDVPCPVAELLLFGASRAQLMKHVIRPVLARGGIVLCDRFADSTTVYQGCARGLSVAFIRQMHELTLDGRWPDVTVLLDLDPDTGFDRRARELGTAAPADRFEAESRDFHQRVRQGFLTVAESAPDRVSVVDATRSAQDVHRQILDLVHHAIVRL